MALMDLTWRDRLLLCSHSREYRRWWWLQERRKRLGTREEDMKRNIDDLLGPSNIKDEGQNNEKRIYRTMDEWLDEVEGYSLRRERVPPDAMPWIEAAWRLATEAALAGKKNG